MKRTLLGASLLLAAGSALANPTVAFDDYARVINVAPAFQEVNRPVSVCDQAAYPQAPQGNNVAGEVVGGLLGGVAGHQVGKGRGNTAATIAGALGGAYLGNRVAGNMEAQAAPQQVCRTQNEYVRQPVGFSTTFRYGNRRFTQIMPHRLRIGTMVPVHASLTVLD